MIMLLLLVAASSSALPRPLLDVNDNLPKHPGGIGGLFRGPNAETIIQGPDGSVITASESPGSIQVEAAAPAAIITQPIVAAEHTVDLPAAAVVASLQPTAAPAAEPVLAVEPITAQQVVVAEPQALVASQDVHVIETEIVDAPEVESEQTAELIGPSGLIKTKGSKSIVSGPSSTTISVPAKAIGASIPALTLVAAEPAVPVQQTLVPVENVPPIQNTQTPLLALENPGLILSNFGQAATDVLPPITVDVQTASGFSGRNTIGYPEEIVPVDLNSGRTATSNAGNLVSTPSTVLLPPTELRSDTLSLPSAELISPAIGSNGISPEYSLSVNLSPEIESVQLSDNIISSSLAPLVDYSQNTAVSSTLPPHIEDYQSIDQPINVEVDYSSQTINGRSVISSTIAPPITDSPSISYSTLGTINVADDDWAQSTISDNSVGILSTPSPSYIVSSTPSSLDLSSIRPIQSTTAASNAIIPSNSIDLGNSQVGAVPQIDTASSYGYINNINEGISTTVRPVTEGPILSTTIGSQAANLQISQETIQRYLDSVAAGADSHDILTPDAALERAASLELGGVLSATSPNVQRIPGRPTEAPVTVDGKLGQLEVQRNEVLSARAQLDSRDLFLSPVAAGHAAAAHALSSSGSFGDLAKYGLTGSRAIFANLDASAVSELRGSSPAISSAITRRFAGIPSNATNSRRKRRAEKVVDSVG